MGLMNMSVTVARGPLHMGLDERYEWRLSDETKKVAKKELREDRLAREQALRQLRDWVKKNSLIQNCRLDAPFLLRFLRVKKFSVPMAQEMLERYLTMRAMHAEWFIRLSQNEDEKFREILNSGYFSVSPKRDQHGRRVLITRARLHDPYKFNSLDVTRAHFLMFEALLEDEENQIRGFTYIIDCEGATVAHITVWSPTMLTSLIQTGEKAMPMRHKQAHFVNLPAPLRYAFDFCKALVSDKIQKRFLIHDSTKALVRYIDKKSLPREYGGIMPIAEMVEYWKREFWAQHDRLTALDNMKLDLDRLKEKNKLCPEMDDMQGLPGSFRKLEFD